jgi:CP family cyanate transporter-like MFS transporter
MLPELRTRLGLSTTTESLLAAIPIVCFGVVSAIAAPSARRFGEERVLGTALAFLALGLALRAVWPASLLFIGTIVAAGSIAVMNVLLSSIIKRRDPAHAGALLAVYLVALSGGSSIASALTVPLYNATGSSLHVGLGVWAIPPLLAIAVWLPQFRHKTVAGPGPRQKLGLIRQPLAWQLTAFMGLQSCCFYSVISWLPTMLRHRGASATAAGIELSLLSVGSMIAALTVPTLAARRTDHRGLIAPSMILGFLGVFVLLFGPLAIATPVALLLGIGQGAVLALALLFIIARSPNSAAAASMSAMAQGVGYTAAALGPLAVGAVHAWTSSWALAFSVILALTLAEWAAAWLAARPLVLHHAVDIAERPS